MHFYHYSLEDLDNMYPFEREIYVEMINNHIKEIQQQQKEKRHR